MFNAEERRYTPVAEIARPRLFFAHLIRDLWRSRHLGLRILNRNLNTQYRQTLFGFAWALVPPLASTAVWFFLHQNKVVAVGPSSGSYALFLITGMMLWQTFVDALLAPLRIANASTPMLTKVSFPHEALLWVAAGEVLVGTLVRMAVLAGALLIAGFPEQFFFGTALHGLLGLLVLGWGFGFWLVPFGLLYHDIGKGLLVISQFWMFLTPVIYPMPPAETTLGAVAQWNPVGPILDLARGGILGALPEQTAFAQGLILIAIAIFALSLVWHRLALPVLIERLRA